MLLALVIGLAVGAAGVTGDVLGPGSWLGVAFSALGSTAFGWAVAAFGVGLTCRTPSRAASAGAATLTVGVVAYYALGVVVGTKFPDRAVSAALVWGIAALVGGPLLGALAWQCRHGLGRSRALALGATAGLLLGPALYLAVKYARVPGEIRTLVMLLVIGSAAPLAISLWLGRSHVRLVALASGSATMVVIGGLVLVYNALGKV